MRKYAYFIFVFTAVLFFTGAIQQADADHVRATVNKISNISALEGAYVEVRCPGGVFITLGTTNSSGVVNVVPGAGADCGAGEAVDLRVSATSYVQKLVYSAIASYDLGNPNDVTIYLTYTNVVQPDAIPPYNPSIAVNNGDENVLLREVKLSVSANGADWVEVSENSDFEGASQVKYTGYSGVMEMDFTLTEGEGIKTVYARFMDNAGNSAEVVSDSIVFGAPTQEQVVVDLSAFADGDLVRLPNTNEIYIVKKVGANSFKRHILNPDIFNSYKHLSWSAVREDITQEQLDAMVTSNLVREDTGSKVYQLSATTDAVTGQKQHINMTATDFEACGYDWGSIYTINATEVSDTFYPTGSNITSCQ